ncbi:MAG: hypothetical protein JRI53_12520 [Deltaproteobacteria bacterium]|nr:hypothetical protein [Deltaproteobacteria bacterium]
MNIIKKIYSRRNFLQWLIKSASLSALFPILRFARAPISHAGASGKNMPAQKSAPVRINIANNRSRTLFKNGLIVDGTGERFADKWGQNRTCEPSRY